MPKNADGIDNILFYFENERQSYRAGTDMVGKVDLYQIINTKIAKIFLYDFNGD